MNQNVFQAPQGLSTGTPSLRPLRVALDVRPLQYPGAHRGIGRYVYQLALALRQRQEQLHLWLLADAGPLPKAFEGWSRLQASGFRPRLRQLGWIWDEAQAGRWNRFPVDLIHLTSGFDLSFGWPLACRLPKVMTVYDLFSLDYRLPGWRRLGRPIYQWLGFKLRWIEGAACISAATCKRLQAHLRKGCPRTCVTPLGATRFEGRSQLPDGLPKRYLLLFPCWPPHKNAASVAEALAPLGASGPPLVVAGNCPDDFRRHLAQAAGELPLYFLGSVDEGSLQALYGRAEALIFPSLREGFGLTPLEALAAGSLAAVADVEPMNEVVNHPDLLFDPHSPQSIRQCCLRLWDLSRREGLISWAQRRALEFSWSRTADETLELYRQIAFPV